MHHIAWLVTEHITQIRFMGAMGNEVFAPSGNWSVA